MSAESFHNGAVFGTWRLVSLNAIRPNGESTTGWLGAKPTGLLVYDPSGAMCVQIMRGPSEPPLRVSDSSHLSYYAYFGTFEIDAGAGTIAHHIQGGVLPEEIGVTYRQDLELSWDELTLLTAPHQSEGERRRNRIVWQRAKRD